MVEELTGKAVEEVSISCNGRWTALSSVQLTQDYVEKLYDLRQQYRNLYKI